LSHALESFRTTVFRQAQFAEFEKQAHDMVEAGQPLTEETLNKTYGDILKQYYGQDKGITKIDDRYAVEWAYVPHFYYDSGSCFYVYKYVTSFVAAVTLAQQILKGTPGAKEKYLTMLGKGSSGYPVDILKDAGVDMTTTSPYEAAMNVMNQLMDEMEKVLAEK